MIYKICRNCKKIISYPNSYCDECKSLKEQEHVKRYYKKKTDPKFQKFYKSKEWDLLKRKKMSDAKYKCEYEGCKQYATEVHHKKPIQTEEGWIRRLDYSNLMCVCLKHHNLLHDRFKERRVKE